MLNPLKGVRQSRIQPSLNWGGGQESQTSRQFPALPPSLPICLGPGVRNTNHLPLSKLIQRRFCSSQLEVFGYSSQNLC